MKINKSNSIAGGIVLLLFGIFLLIVLFGCSLLSRDNTSLDMGFLGKATVHLPVIKNTLFCAILYLLLPLLPILCLERGVYDLRRGIGVRKDALEGTKSVWRTLAAYYKYADFVNNIIFSLVFLALTAFALRVLLRAELIFTVNTLMYLIGLALYVVLRKTFGKSVRKASNALRKGFPSYTLLENAIEMRLYPVGKSSRAVNPPNVTLRFDELDEVKVLSDVEAVNYLKYSVGPDLSLSRKMVEDKVRYLKGEIARPSVFKSGTCTNSKSVLFRGKDLFYLMTFETDEVDSIEVRFKTYCQSRQPVGSGD